MELRGASVSAAVGEPERQVEIPGRASGHLINGGVMKRVLFLLAAMSGSALAQVSHDDMNKSNNPLNPTIGANIQDAYTPKLYGSDRYTNDLLLRGTMPIAPSEHMKAPQIIRVTVPVSTRPDPNGGYVTGLGDLNSVDIFVLGKTAGGGEYGAGPVLVLPTATDDALGTGKWQGGLAMLAMHPTPRGILGGLFQIQGSFAGDKDRSNVASATLQPFFIRNLREGWYLRSTGIWTFNLKNDDYFIPVGLGAGKVWKSAGGSIFNVFVEPQWTVAHEGNGLPKFAVFMGLNMTFER